MLISDHDFHPEDREVVRVFDVPRVDVARLDDAGLVYRVRYQDVVLHHYAWTRRWYKVNVTTDLHGRLVETGSGDWAPFCFNIDIATPMLPRASDVYAVDLFLDLLVRANTTSHVVMGHGEMERAVRDGSISERELAAGASAVAMLTAIVKTGHLMRMLTETWPLDP